MIRIPQSFPCVMALSALLLVCACDSETVTPQKSPCVGIDNSPCGPKRPVNGQLNDRVENVTVVAARA